MHKRILIYSTILAAVLAASCTKADQMSTSETPVPIGGGTKPDTLYTVLEQTGDTKLELSGPVDDKYSMLWEENETITVLCDNGGTATYKLASESGKASGTFAGTLPEGATKAVYALLSGDNLATDGNALTFSIPQEKDAVAGNVGQAFPAVAQVGAGGSVALYNVIGLLRVDFNGTAPNIIKIVLRDLAGNDLWGNCRVPIKDDGSLDYENATVTGGGNTIALNFAEGTDISGNSYFFPIPVGALDGGFAIVLYEADDTKTDGVGRAYSFLQKITGTKAMLRSCVYAINASVTEKSEPLSVKERGYYKSLFVNSGYGLDRFKGDTEPENSIPAIDYMGLINDYEYFYGAGNVESYQTGVIIGNDNDANGVLLYPDGSPRFRLIFNSGGNSQNHGKSLGYEGRRRFYHFFNNGGSYTSVCAGSFLAAQSVDGNNRDGDGEEDFTYGFIPVNLYHTGLPYPMDKYRGIYTNMEILSDAKSIIAGVNGDNKFNLLLNGSIADVMHHGGGYLHSNQTSQDGIKVLMKYRYSITKGSSDINPEDGASYDAHYYRQDTKDNDLFGGRERDGYNSTWTYKPSTGNTGRAVCTGSHPEGTDRDCDKQFTGFMFRYAMEGNGEAIVKDGDLQFGQPRYMNDSPASYDNPASNDAGIGDRQYHHFKFDVPAGGYDNICLSLNSDYDKDSGIDLYLGLKEGGLAWFSEADYLLCNKGGRKEIRIKHLPEGTWYVSVFCATTVEADLYQADSGYLDYYKYSGKTQVLNGIPYSICIAQDGSAKEYFPTAFGEDGDDFSNTMDD